MKTKTQITNVIGFDLGHGETALAWVSTNGDPTPKMLEIHGRRSQITALAWQPDGNLIIGEQAVTLNNVTRFDICFKRRPTDDPQYRETMQ